MKKHLLILSFLFYSMAQAADFNLPVTPQSDLSNPAALLPENDPVRHRAYAPELAGPAAEMAEAIKRHDWNHKTLRTPAGYDLVLYAYVHKLISKEQFMDAQDYLQLQTDFASPETAAFNSLLEQQKISVRVPVNSVRRIRFSELPDNYLPNWKNRPDIQNYFNTKQDWLTEIVLFKQDYYSLEADVVTQAFGCHDVKQGSAFTCMARNLPDKRLQLLTWNSAINPALYTQGMHFNDHEVILIFANVNLEVNKSPMSNLEFIPLYGSLNWEHLNAMRAIRKNPGTLYHPDVANNFFEPHGLYSGASHFLRHDLFHQTVIAKIPFRYRQFLIWLHEQEQKILKKMDQALVSIEAESLDVTYSGNLSHSGTSLPKLCQTSFQRYRLDAINHRQPVSFYWPDTETHQSLFKGYFADMDHVVLFSQNNLCSELHGDECEIHFSGKTLRGILKYQCEDAGFNFPSSFELYHGLLEDTLREHEVYIQESFGISVIDLLQ